LILNGKADAANQKVEKLLAVIPGSRSAWCEGDHHSTPFEPTFQEAVIDFLKEHWRGKPLQPIHK
jgi:hypothetical protein